MKGFTLIEIIIVFAVFATIITIATINLANVQHKSTLSATVNSFIADFRGQQMRALTGDTQGSSAVSNYGVHITSSSYTLFRNTYGTANFTINVSSPTQISTTFPNSEIIFTAGSGALTSYTSGQNTITFTDTVDGNQKTITVNRYGVISAVN